MVLYGTIAQMEERQVEALRVEGSIPSCPTKARNGSLLFMSFYWERMPSVKSGRTGRPKALLLEGELPTELK